MVMSFIISPYLVHPIFLFPVHMMLRYPDNQHLVSQYPYFRRCFEWLEKTPERHHIKEMPGSYLSKQTPCPKNYNCKKCLASSVTNVKQRLYNILIPRIIIILEDMYTNLPAKSFPFAVGILFLQSL